ATESENQKRSWLLRALSSWAELVEPVRAVSGEERWGYRDKTVLFAQPKGEFHEFGMRIPGKRRGEYELVPIPDCPVHSARVRSAVQWVVDSVPGHIPLAFVSVSGALLTL